MLCFGLKCQLSGDAPQGSWSSINGVNCYGGVVLNPTPISATYRVYLGKAPLLVQCIAPGQGCLFEAGQLYGSPWIMGKTRIEASLGRYQCTVKMWIKFGSFFTWSQFSQKLFNNCFSIRA